MAQRRAALGSIAASFQAKMTIAPVLAKPTARTAQERILDGPLHGLPIAGHCTTVPQQTLLAARGPSGRSLHGGTRKREDGKATTPLTSNRINLQTTSLIGQKSQ